MAVVAIQVQSENGRTFSKDEVEIYQMPRVGERLQLGSLTGVTEPQNSSVEIKSVVHRISPNGGTITPILIVNMSEISTQIQDKILTDWETVHLNN